MTTVKSSNVYNIALKGNFDDCQYIIKKLFNDNDTKKKSLHQSILLIGQELWLKYLIIYMLFKS